MATKFLTTEGVKYLVDVIDTAIDVVQRINTTEGVRFCKYSTYDQKITADLPLAYWKLQETEGTSAVEEIAANNGTYAAGYTLNQPGFIAAFKSVAVDGVDASRITIPNAAFSPITGTAALSIESWVRPASLPPLDGNIFMFFSTDGASNQNYMSFNRNGGVQAVLVSLRINGAQVAVRSTGFTPTAATWYHIVETYDGSKVRIYVNGVDYSPVNAPSGNVDLGVSAGRLGGWVVAGGFGFPGNISHTAMYATVLSPTTIVQHYSMGLAARTNSVVPIVG